MFGGRTTARRRRTPRSGRARRTGASALPGPPPSAATYDVPGEASRTDAGPRSRTGPQHVETHFPHSHRSPPLAVEFKGHSRRDTRTKHANRLIRLAFLIPKVIPEAAANNRGASPRLSPLVPTETGVEPPFGQSAHTRVRCHVRRKFVFIVVIGTACSSSEAAFLTAERESRCPNCERPYT